MFLFLIVVSPETVRDSVEIQTEEPVLWRIGQMATLTWNSDPFDSLADDVKVDISLGTYNSDGLLQRDVMLATDLPNSGMASIHLPDSLNSTLSSYSENGLLVGIVKVGVNTSTTNMGQFKHSADESFFRRILSVFKASSYIIIHHKSLCCGKAFM